VLEDEGGLLWVACHFGSRGFGHKTASGFMNIAAGQAFDARAHDGKMDAPPLLLDATQPSGQD
jgi:tRNA-splicing ligase RtcB (3'-phosphate/5'-hydroxy nucleic acid ligase)